MYTDQRALSQSVFQAVAQRCENQIEVCLNNSTILQHSLLSQIYHTGEIYYSHPDTLVCVSNPFLLSLSVVPYSLRVLYETNIIVIVIGTVIVSLNI